MLRSGKNLTERILLIGAEGTGKSYDWLKIADLAQRTGATTKFYCVDTDNAIRRMLAEEFPHLTNVELTIAIDWEEILAAVRKYVKTVGPEDWLIVDMFGPSWDEVQDFYTNEVWGQDFGSYMLEVRKQIEHVKKEYDAKVAAGQKVDPKKDAPPSSVYEGGFQGWKDWNVIKAIYRPLTKAIMKCPCNLLCTAQTDMFNQSEDEKSLRMMYAGYGVKPRGEKRIGHLFHTVIWVQHPQPTLWWASTIKDRGRKILQGDRLNNFAVDYLVKVAGWKL